ncbi:DUF1634 domain-containing protein [Parabacteroides sp. Marseille-P3160]|uniref:DUF1634 domain-containing protein n=1 Tax=Parabacteroides sp. Marseille-P3160 TaxID=1917887 RepID=UPI0009BA35ED|nr:DUF1634 domain-containing protein [Parabacteroides sp. Marseille-P3160]
MKRIFTKEFWMERDVELLIGKLLRYGVVLSCCITGVGAIFYLYQHHGVTADYSSTPAGEPFPGVDAYLRELPCILPHVLEGDGAAIIQLGVIVLIATPVIRVAFSALAFFIERDYLYVFITLLVLAIILSNIFFGLH